jgi:hypothetical protein
MQKITTTIELRAAIALLEEKQELQEKQLKEQFYATYESFKTINLFKKVLIEVVTSPGLMSGMISSVVEMIQRRNRESKEKEESENTIHTIIKSLLKTGVSKLVIENSDSLLLLGQYIIKRIFQHKEKKDKGEE